MARVLPLRRVACVELGAAPGFDLRLAGRVYALPWEFDGESAYVVVSAEGERYVVRVEQHGSALRCAIYGERRPEAPEDLARLAVRVLGADEDLSEFHRLVRGDPLLGVLAGELRGLRMRGRPSLWEALLIAVCQQNASFAQGWSMVERLCCRLGERLKLEDGRLVLGAPSPDAVLGRQHELTACGLGYRADFLAAVAEEAARGALDESVLQRLPAAEAIRRLTRIRGVGRYTASLGLIIALRRYDVFPVDRWFAGILGEIYAGRKLSLKEAEGLAEKLWGRWRGLAAILLTVVLAARPLKKALELARRGIDARLLLEEPGPSPLTLFRRPLTDEARALLAEL